MPDDPDPRALMQAQATASLGTLMDGAPYVSLVLVAFEADGSPLLLLSHLAQHTRNLLADARVSLLFDGTAGFDAPLTGPRLTVLGSAAVCSDPQALEGYLARHPSAAAYAGFSDFDLYRVAIECGQLVGGFGKNPMGGGSDSAGRLATSSSPAWASRAAAEECGRRQ